MPLSEEERLVLEAESAEETRHRAQFAATIFISIGIGTILGLLYLGSKF